MPLPPAVSALVTERLDTVDAALPGFVTALWVTGSAASGDWRPDRSDVDFVAATNRVPTLADVEALAALHASPGEPLYDGLYVAEADPAAPPSAEQPAAHVVPRRRVEEQRRVRAPVRADRLGEQVAVEADHPHPDAAAVRSGRGQRHRRPGPYAEAGGVCSGSHTPAPWTRRPTWVTCPVAPSR